MGRAVGKKADVAGGERRKAAKEGKFLSTAAVYALHAARHPTKASLSTDSFISAASSREDPPAYWTEAASWGSADGLRGLKKNVMRPPDPGWKREMAYTKDPQRTSPEPPMVGNLPMTEAPAPAAGRRKRRAGNA